MNELMEILEDVTKDLKDGKSINNHILRVYGMGYHLNFYSESEFDTIVITISNQDTTAGLEIDPKLIPVNIR